MYSNSKSALLRLFYFFFVYSFSTSILAFTFESSEHIALGDDIKLYFKRDDPGELNYHLHLPNGLVLTYGDILALGDLYAVPNQPIALGKNAAERKKRFLLGFNSFASNQTAVDEAKKLMQVLHHEKEIIETVIKEGGDPVPVYIKMANETNRQLNCITGGGCSRKWWLKPGRYMKISISNVDHFGSYAWIAYNVGHKIALEQAVIAKQTKDLKRLEIAYAMNAYASHFLSDSFASGHIRPPRIELVQHIHPSIYGYMLVNFMHYEENEAGIHVHNRNGDEWIAYGDRYFFNHHNIENRKLLQQALQISTKEIFQAYLSGHIEKHDIVKRLIPIPNETQNNANLDISPLFYWDNRSQTIMRRVDLYNKYDRHWTAKWNVLTTYLILNKQYGDPFTTVNDILTS